MGYSSQLCANRRVPRFRLTDTTPAVLQFRNGLRMAGELHVISRNGGLVLLPDTVRQGSVVELLFQTHRGPVLGTAEMLMPVTRTQQPFRFIAMPDGDQLTLQTAFESGVYRNTDAEERIEELRVAVANAVAKWHPSPWRRRFVGKLTIGLIALIGCLVCAFFIYQFPH
jgi:hypothetical protein